MSDSLLLSRVRRRCVGKSTSVLSISRAGPDLGEQHGLRWVGESRTEVPGHSCAEESIVQELGVTWTAFHLARKWWVELKQAGAQGACAVHVCSSETEVVRERHTRGCHISWHALRDPGGAPHDTSSVLLPPDPAQS